jgi:hypothetical protein
VLVDPALRAEARALSTALADRIIRQLSARERRS